MTLLIFCSFLTLFLFSLTLTHWLSLFQWLWEMVKFNVAQIASQSFFFLFLNCFCYLSIKSKPLSLYVSPSTVAQRNCNSSFIRNEPGFCWLTLQMSVIVKMMSSATWTFYLVPVRIALRPMFCIFWWCISRFSLSKLHPFRNQFLKSFILCRRNILT